MARLHYWLAQRGRMIAFLYYAFLVAGGVMAVFFGVLFFHARQVVQLLCAGLWLLPIAYEYWVLSSCTGECNIRIDLIMIFPAEVLVLGTISTVAWRMYKRSAQAAN
jgi:hypothetical protein